MTLYTVESLRGKQNPNNRHDVFVIGVYDSHQKAKDAISDAISKALGDYVFINEVEINHDITMSFYKFTILGDEYYKGFRIRQLVLGEGFRL